MKKILSLCLSIIMVLGFSACREVEENMPGGENMTATVRFLNFKPEVASAYEEIAAEYQKEKGVKVIVETAASGTYESTLAAKMGTADAPTIFQTNGPRGYANWKDYCADLKNTKIYSYLTDKSLAIKSGDGVYGIPFLVEGYGIIYNNAIMNRYFGLTSKGTNFTSMDQIRSFDSLKALVEDMQKNKEALGIDGVFASTSLKTGEDWRWQTHLANIPVYYEFDDNDVDTTGSDIETIAFKYSENFKNIFDLYINNSTVDKKILGSKIVDDSMAEFALGKAAMVQNGNWAWSQIKNVSGNSVSENDIKFLPIYMGVEDEEEQGLCIGTENFLCINAKASEADRKAAEDFLDWLYSSSTGKKYVTEKLGFITPFNTFTDEEKPTDPLAREVISWMEKDGVDSIPWNFTLFPSQTFKNNFGSALLRYAQGTVSWDEVKKQFSDEWASEYKNIVQ